ncbi:SipW-dependent-type signal peptide-containing protein [Haloarchaeobius sp. DYHT-AS-18]|uniref:SipW-dependent-type signal peptide-containing protein n=1 Tax=Haloarchaeobius sp. DYHT-AS-18 TaxID=3446117 RepID=UPI003EBC0265
MSGNGLEISRRKALAAIGSTGIASVGAGFGTSAFFSDTETFEGNQLVAGELDMKVDWTEHYSDWSDDELEGVTVSMTDDRLEYGFPSAAANKMVYVDDRDAFLANTAIEAFPDTLTQNPGENEYDGRQVSLDPDDQLCDLDADLDEALSNQFRTGANVSGGVTIGEGPNAQTTAAGDPLVNISDIKPGDFGEVTFSIHLCGNPGWVWMTGGLVDADENGNTDPEAADEDEISSGEEDPQNRDLFENEGDESGEPNTDPADTSQEPVELLDAINTALWYDTGPDGAYGTGDSGEGDNFHEEGETFIPLTGTLRNVLQLLEEGRVPLDYTPDGGDGTISIGGAGSDICTSTDDALYQLTNSDLHLGSNRNVSCEELDDMLVSHGYAETGTEYVGTKVEADALHSGTYTAGNGGTIQVDSVNIEDGTVTLSTDFPVEAVGIKGGNGGEHIYVFEEKGGTDPAEPEEYGCILDGVTFHTATDQAISHIEVCYDPTVPTDLIIEGDPGRECFPNSTTAYVGFEWWLPVDHANEIQGDSVSFDIGFYTEQCRHNDGSGQPPADG